MKSNRLERLTTFAAELGFVSHRRDENRLDVTLAPGSVLVFCNIVDDDELLIGFDGVSWHAHGVVQLMTGPDTYIECDEYDVLAGLVAASFSW